MEQIISDFQNPPTESRAKPFWAWNGKLEEEELLRQIHILHEMGFGGFFMHSRTGLQTEYLGEKWFRLTDACAKEAKALGMEPWIYDEDRWPSGPAGGLVTRDVRFRRKYLTLSVGKPDSGGTPVAAFSARVEGLCLEPGYRSIAPDGPLEDGETRLLFCVHTMDPSPTYNGYTDADRLSLAATRRFLELTHEQYASRCERFDGICGVFTDEPHRGMVFSDFSDPGEARCWSLPWTDDLAEQFEETFSQPLLPRLPELFLCLRGQQLSMLKWQYMELLQRLFQQRFLKPIQDWAHENGKRTTGHFLHEDSLTAQAVPTGSLMRCYEYLDEPGMDNLTENSFAPWAAKQLESAARQLGKEKKLTELYGATGWGMSFPSYKYVGDWQVLLGINIRCPHLSWYTMEGEAKRDYPASFLHQVPWGQEHGALEEYFARLGILATAGQPVCDTLVLHPVESLWYQIHPGWVKGLEAVDPAIQRLETRFRQLFHWLMESQTDFDYGDEGLLADHGSVEEEQETWLRVGRMRYRRVIVGGCAAIRKSTWALLEEFRARGGQVVLIGQPPRCMGVDGNLEGLRLPMRKGAVLQWLRSLKQPVAIQDDDAAKDVYMQLRRDGSGLLVLLWNKSRRRTLHTVPVRIPEGLWPELWDCTEGTCRMLPVENGCVHLDFAPGQERTIWLSPVRNPLPPADTTECGRTLALTKPEWFSLSEPNVLVLDRAELRSGDKEFGRNEILELGRLLRQSLGLDPRSGEMLQPWARKPAGKYVPLSLRFSVSMEQIPESPILLAMEQLPEQQLLLNGTAVTLEKTDHFWVDHCFSVYALPMELWQLGENCLELRCSYSADNGLEALYLLGGFGVWFRRGQPVLGAMPAALHTGDLTCQGLPFYGGKVRYGYRLPESGRFAAQLPKLGGACASILCGEKKKLLLWNWQRAELEGHAGSMVEVEAVLTRRNTFGPLHRFPRKQPFTAPDSFVCEDLDRYCLEPAGLLREPVLHVMEKER